MFETSPLPVHVSKSADGPPASPLRMLRVALGLLVITACLTATIFTLGVFLTGCQGDAKQKANDAKPAAGAEDGNGSPPAATAIPKFAYEIGAGFIDVRPVDAATGQFAAATQKVFPINFANGGTVDATGEFAYVVQASTPSQVSGCTIDGTTGALTPTAQASVNLDGAANTIPSQAITDPSGKFLYVLNDGAGHLSVSGFAINRTTGALTEVAGSPYALAAPPNGIAVAPSGKFLYVSLATTNPNVNILPFAINAVTGTLTAGTAVKTGTTGSFPTSLTLDPAGKRLYVTENGTAVSGYSIDSVTGALTALTNSPFTTSTLAGPSTSAVIDSTGSYLYLGLTFTPDNLLAYAIDATTGGLTELPGSPYGAFGGTAGDVVYATIDPSGRFLYVASAFGSAGTDGFSIDAATGQLTHITGFPLAGGNNQVVTITGAIQ